MRVRRGYILLIAGGALIAIGMAVFAYYGMRLLSGIQAQTVEVPPRQHLVVSQVINASQAAYLVALSAPPESLPTMTIKDPANRTLVSKQINSAIAFDIFTTSSPGNYTLDLVNPSNSSSIQASASLGDQQQIVTKRIDLTAAFAAVAFVFLMIAGVGVVIAGGVITVFDKRRISKMKQYGDTSDLV